MRWKLVWTRPAMKDLKKLDRTKARRVREALLRFAETGEGDVTKLTDVKPPEWRQRIGDQRAFLRFHPSDNELVVLRVRPRSRAYNR